MRHWFCLWALCIYWEMITILIDWFIWLIVTAVGRPVPVCTAVRCCWWLDISPSSATRPKLFTSLFSRLSVTGRRWSLLRWPAWPTSLKKRCSTRCQLQWSTSASACLLVVTGTYVYGGGVSRFHTINTYMVVNTKRHCKNWERIQSCIRSILNINAKKRKFITPVNGIMTHRKQQK